ncbi:MAG: hypothetical protein ACODAC_04825 [Pseudomonadota bacterium]
MPEVAGGDGGPTLTTVVAHRLRVDAHRDDPGIARLLAAIHERHGGHVAAVLLYGSYLRGKRDTLLDFYVLLDDLRGALPRRWHEAANRLLPPNVYHLSLPGQPGAPPLRAKYATMTVAAFETGMRRFHSYFWSRFTQPCGLVYARDADTRAAVTRSLGAAVDTFVQRVAPMLDPPFASPALWRRGFALTYACELRAEDGDGVARLYRHDADHFDALLRAYAGEPGAAVRHTGTGYAGTRHPSGRGRARWGWRVRQIQGKLLSVARLVKAAGTFDDPLDYLLWKIARHSGIQVTPTDRQRRHPLIFAWPLLWRLYRRGAFR